MPMVSPAMTALTTVAMMIAMMLPSIAPTVWHYHRRLRAMNAPHAGRRSTIFVLGYASVWAMVSMALFAIGMTSPTGLRFAPLAAGAVVLCAGVLQCSRWKTRKLLSCRHECVTASAAPNDIIMAWLGGWRLGIDCCVSCAAPMAVLFVTGFMDMRMMVVITAAITAERVAPGGVRVARLTGALAVIAALVMCVRA